MDPGLNANLSLSEHFSVELPPNKQRLFKAKTIK
jgi:hypothetical protein